MRAGIVAAVAGKIIRQFGHNFSPVMPRIISEGEMQAGDDACVRGAFGIVTALARFVTAAAGSNPNFYSPGGWSL
jgi:hypothetical protein